LPFLNKQVISPSTMMCHLIPHFRPFTTMYLSQDLVPDGSLDLCQWSGWCPRYSKATNVCSVFIHCPWVKPVTYCSVSVGIGFVFECASAPHRTVIFLFPTKTQTPISVYRDCNQKWMKYTSVQALLRKEAPHIT